MSNVDRELIKRQMQTSGLLDLNNVGVLSTVIEVAASELVGYGIRKMIIPINSSADVEECQYTLTLQVEKLGDDE